MFGWEGEVLSYKVVVSLATDSCQSVLCNRPSHSKMLGFHFTKENKEAQTSQWPKLCLFPKILQKAPTPHTQWTDSHSLAQR